MRDGSSAQGVVSSGLIEPLTSLQRRLVVALALVVAATRLLAVSHSMWDWDEALFASALHHYDVAQHHPHPPGFPLFFALAKLARFVIQDDFHALRDISILASLFVFPSMFALARSLRFRFRTCVVAALLFSFLPNVWYWGGTGFTDELALVTALAGSALLLRDERQPGSYLAGCALFAATMLVRAQNVLLAWPWIVAAWRRLRSGRRAEVLAGTAMILVLVVVGYGIAAKLTGFEEYLLATKWHQQYVATVDGSLNPMRTPMRYLFYDFLFDPFQSHAASGAVFVFLLVAFTRPRRAHGHVLLTFLPSFFLAWFLLNPSGISRLSLGYIASNILLAADGMDVAASFIASRVRALPLDRIAAAVQAFFAALTIGLSVVWVWAGLKEVRTFDSPPVQAMRWIRQNVRRGGKIYMRGGLEPFTAYFLPDYRIVPVPDDFDASKAPAETNVYLVSDHPEPFGQTINFLRPRKRLWALFNRRYFEVSVVPMSGWMRFGAGWYGEERGAGEQWRWMGKESHTLLAPLGSRALLGFTAMFPLDREPSPMVTVSFDGSVIDRFVPKQRDVQRSYIVMSGRGRPDELVISVDRAINPARMHAGTDARDLALQLRLVTWKRP